MMKVFLNQFGNCATLSAEKSRFLYCARLHSFGKKVLVFMPVYALKEVTTSQTIGTSQTNAKNAEETVRKINEKTDCKATLYDLDDKEKLREEMADSYIFVNGTGVGMKPLEGMSVVPDKSFFRPELIVIDVPYSPLETKMRSMAKEVGCKTMNGLGMMLFQGAAAFKLWTGKDMPIEHMKEVLNIRYDD